METCKPLSIDSFSYSWLVNLKPSLDSPQGNSFRTSLDASDEANSFIEMDPRMPPSKRFFSNSQDFKFDFPLSPPSLSFADADQLISNGYLMPLFTNSAKVPAFQDSDYIRPLPATSSSTLKDDSAGGSDCSSLKKCKRLPKQIFEKYFNFLKPLYRRIRGHGASSKAGKMERRSQSVKNWAYPSESSPRISVAYSADCWRKSCDSESSIYEAVLHCKRSIGK